MTQPLSPKCPYCNGAGEYEHPAYRELDEFWRKGWLFDEEGITHFWADRGYDPANPPARYSVCNACGGTGDAPGTHENPALEARALAAWREANPGGFIGRLVELHQRDPQKALVLARYAEPHGYEGLVLDVASWPMREPAPCPSCSGSGRWDDGIPCGRCGGEGVR